jgi:hypothetical protein
MYKVLYEYKRLKQLMGRIIIMVFLKNLTEKVNSSQQSRIEK